MKLQPALLFGENMLLQRRKPIYVWGRSVRDDVVTVTLDGVCAEGVAVAGQWKVELPPMEAVEKVTMTIASRITGERVEFTNVAIGEVWLAGGQSNMEFLLKYDEDFASVCETGDDPCLRYFRYPQANYVGCVEKQPYPDDGFWRSWTVRSNREFFSGPAAYMGRMLRKTLGVPVGFVGCSWGGTPAAAWTALEDIQANPALRTVLDWHEESCGQVNYPAYYSASDRVEPEPDPEYQKRMDFLMMGGDFSKLPPMPMPDFSKIPYTAYMPGPRACIRPAGLYENILCHIAPYAIRGAVWYQGEDDDFRGWVDFYDESMKTLINSWRKLWGFEMPFFQVELAPFRGRGFNGAKDYPRMRTMQRAAADALPGVRNICIMDAGDAMNIHVRRKRPVGERLALLARKYVYGEEDLLADSPRAVEARREGNAVRIRFDDAGEGLVIKGDMDAVLEVIADGEAVAAAAETAGSELILRSEVFASAGEITVKFAEQNFCVDPLYSSADLPAFPFTFTVR